MKFLSPSVFPNVISLPAAGTAGRVVYLTSDKHFYGDNGSSWDDLTVNMKPKFSSAAGFIPTAADIVDGELFINTADKIIYQRVGSNIIAVANFSPISGITLIKSADQTSGSAIDSELTATLGAGIYKFRAQLFLDDPSELGIRINFPEITLGRGIYQIYGSAGLIGAGDFTIDDQAGISAVGSSTMCVILEGVVEMDDVSAFQIYFECEDRHNFSMTMMQYSNLEIKKSE